MKNNLKILSQVSAKNKKLPILQNISIRSNIALASGYGETFVIADLKKLANLSLDNGLYLGAAFADGVHVQNTEFDQNNFPEPNDNAIYLQKITVKKDDLKWLSLAMSKEQSRYYLNGIVFTEHGLAATDGHRLHLLPKFKADIDELKNQIMPADFIKTVLMAAGDLVTLEFTPTHARAKIMDGLIINSKYIDDTFPDIGRVIPVREDNHFSVNFDYKNYKMVFPTWKKSICKKSLAVKFSVDKQILSFSEEYSNIKYGDLFIEAGCGADIGFNGSYLLDIGIGNFTVASGSSPALFVEGNRKAVLMPLRI